MKTLLLSHPARPLALALAGLFCGLALAGTARGLQIHQQMLGPFADAREVAVKCLECHQQQADAVLLSTHWTWLRQRTLNGQQVSTGKKDSLVGFAIDVTANAPRCLRCHISTSPQKESFAAPAADMVDCLACHDTTGIYRHDAVPAQGSPDDFAAIARNVGQPTPRNCTGCHFADCGLTPTPPEGKFARGVADLTDVHLRADGPAFTCQTCHPDAGGHSPARRVDAVSGTADRGTGCAACHTATPHALDLLNQHGQTIACQSCHIPAYGLGGPVLIAWNWLMTGKTNSVFRAGSGSGLQLHDQNGFWSAGEIEPVYLWDDGSDMVYTRGQKIQPQELTILQQPGEKSPDSKLAPFRVLYGTQLYDSKYRYLISPLLQPEGEKLFPGSDWETIARKGMEVMVLPFSGQYGFTATAAYRRINHGVTPAADALDCLDCHGATGRIRWELLGFDRDPMLEVLPAGSTLEIATPPEQVRQPPPPEVQQQPAQDLLPEQPGVPSLPPQIPQQPDALPSLPPVQEPLLPPGPGR